MITTAAEFLGALVDLERQRLDGEDLDHGPTIGRMYEGLTADVLDRAVPSSLGLQVVNGFVEDGSGEQSGQIDCMLVTGAGRSVPYTDSFVWHVKDVVAVFEIKKRLDKQDLGDGIDHLRAIRRLHRAWATRTEPAFEWRFALESFSEIAGHHVNSLEDTAVLPRNLRALFAAVAAAHIEPLRILFGYSGYKTERGFRTALVDLLDATAGRGESGPASYPDMITSGGVSVVKGAGTPWTPFMQDDWWPFYLSSPANPILLLLELVFSRLHRMFGFHESLWGEDLEMEPLHPFLAARHQHIGMVGWEPRYIDLSAKQLRATSEPTAWEPVVLSELEARLLHRLLAGEDVGIDDHEITAELAAEGLEVDHLRRRLRATTLVAFDGDRIVLTARKPVLRVLDDGRTVAAENETGRLTRWLEARARSASEDT